NRQAALWNGFRVTWRIREGAGGGRRLIDGARWLGRRLVRDEVEAARAGMDPVAQGQLDEDFAEIGELEGRDRDGRLGQAGLAPGTAARAPGRGSAAASAGASPWR